MKALVTVLCFLFSASAFASIDFSQGQNLDQFQINGKPSEFTGPVTIEKAQIGENINVHVLAPIECPAGRVCPEVMQEINLNAKIVSIEESCGSIIYTGVTDKSPSDGPLTEIRVLDHSTRICEDIRAGLIEVEAKVRFLKTQKVTKYFGVQSYKDEASNFDLKKGVQMNIVNLSGDEAGGRDGYVKVNEATGKVLVSYTYMYCVNNACQAMFQTKKMNLKLVSKKNDGCGSVVYKAVTSEIIPGGDYSEVTIADNSKRVCEDVLRAFLVVEGVTRYPYPGRAPNTFELLK